MNHEHVEYIFFAALKISNLQGKLFGHICQTQEAFESKPAQDVSRGLTGPARGCGERKCPAFPRALSPWGLLGVGDKGDPTPPAPTRSEGQEDAPHVPELVVVAVPPALPAFLPARAVHPKREQLPALQPSKAVTSRGVLMTVIGEQLGQATSQPGVLTAYSRELGPLQAARQLPGSSG